jgi:hypothetical protein
VKEYMQEDKEQQVGQLGHEEAELDDSQWEEVKDRNPTIASVPRPFFAEDF